MRAAPAGTPQAGGGVTDSYGFRAAPLRSAPEGQPIKMGAPATGRAMKDREVRVPTVRALPRSLLGKKIRRLWPGRLSINRLSVRTGKWPLVEVAALHDPICGAGPHSGNFSSGNRSDAGELLGSRLRHQSADKRRAHDGDVPDVWRTSGSQMSVSDVTERSHYCGFDPTNHGTWHRAIGLCQPARVRIQ